MRLIKLPKLIFCYILKRRRIKILYPTLLLFICFATLYMNSNRDSNHFVETKKTQPIVFARTQDIGGHGYNTGVTVGSKSGGKDVSISPKQSVW